MPPFYFHGNYSRYMRTITLFDRANSQFDTLFFNTNTIISYAFSPAMNKSLYTTLITITVIHNMACLLHHCCHHWNTLLTTSLLCSHPLTGLHQHSESVNGCCFSTGGNSVTHLCFICTSISDSILSDCHLFCCHLSHDNKMQRNTVRKVQPLVLCHQHQLLISWPNINK